MTNERPPAPLKQDVPELEQPGQKAGVQLIWFVLLALPLLALGYSMLSRPEAPATGPGIIIYTPPPRPAGQEMSADTPRRGSALSCYFDEWVGRQADAAMQNAIKAKGRPFRVLPPGWERYLNPSPRDRNSSRINFDVDSRGIITRVWCG